MFVRDDDPPTRKPSKTPGPGCYKSMWSFPQIGGTLKFMVFVRENPFVKWMMTGGTPMTQDTSISVVGDIPQPPLEGASNMPRNPLGCTPKQKANPRRQQVHGCRLLMPRKIGCLETQRSLSCDVRTKDTGICVGHPQHEWFILGKSNETH